MATIEAMSKASEQIKAYSCIAPSAARDGDISLEPRFPFWILSRSFGEKPIFLQSCETKSGTESLGPRLDKTYIATCG